MGKSFNQFIAMFVFTYSWLSPIYSIFLSVYLTKRLAVYGMHALGIGVIVCCVNLLAFFPVVVGGEGFAAIMPWFYVFYRPAHFSEELSILAVCYALFTTSMSIVLFIPKNNVIKLGVKIGEIFGRHLQLFSIIIGILILLFIVFR